MASALLSGECVLCGWEFSWLDPPRAVYRLDKVSPLRWTTRGLLQEPLSLTPETVVAVAMAAHWADEHPEQFVGALEVDQGVTEWVWGTPML